MPDQAPHPLSVAMAKAYVRSKCGKNYHEVVDKVGAFRKCKATRDFQDTIWTNQAEEKQEVQEGETTRRRGFKGLTCLPRFIGHEMCKGKK
ncbi:hypothetical protein RRG08_028570 [Elysia crispata]|uniref:Uncharacterized protein n=1 Tax=Elysia crispata TaxID=231223 RepID=A0AAE1CVG4_9GAST|nr:hypothetical protein RRG08_028570 [Elysia crispata]